MLAETGLTMKFMITSFCRDLRRNAPRAKRRSAPGDCGRFRSSRSGACPWRASRENGAPARRAASARDARELHGRPRRQIQSPQKRGSSEHNAHIVIAGGQRLSVGGGLTMNFMIGFLFPVPAD